MSKYIRTIKTFEHCGEIINVEVDVYDVLKAFNVVNPATQHAVKKLLCTGIRGHKSALTDLEEACQSVERAIDLEKSC
tara:strand:+ start:189 stop:422 length:234 start_codon:yes stop_codon:yes gene_type:complete